jgi:hypothetical protein
LGVSVASAALPYRQSFTQHQNSMKATATNRYLQTTKGRRKPAFS